MFKQAAVTLTKYLSILLPSEFSQFTEACV